MFRFLLGTFVIVLLTTIFGFGGSLVTGAVETAKVLFYVLVVLIVLFLMLGPVLFRRR